MNPITTHLLVDLLLLLLDPLDTRVDAKRQVYKHSQPRSVLLLAASTLGLVLLFCVSFVISSVPYPLDRQR